MVAESSTLSDLIASFGWVLLHFVWQGAVVGLLAVFLLALLRGRSANVRYLAGVVMLRVLCTMSLLTMSLMERATASKILVLCHYCLFG